MFLTVAAEPGCNGLQEQVWDDSSFYVWLDDRPTSLWYYVALILLPVVSLRDEQDGA